MKIKIITNNYFLLFGSVRNNMFFLMSCLVICLISCNKKQFDNDVELLAFINNESNGYFQNKLINGINFELLYRPTDLLVNQELNNQKDINKLREKYKRFIFFNLSISTNDKEILTAFPKNRMEYSALVDQLTFKMDRNIVMLNQHKDTIPLIDVVNPRLYGMGKKNTLLLIFNRADSKLIDENLNLFIKDFGFNVGDIRFKIPIEKIKNEPTISFKSS